MSVSFTATPSLVTGYGVGRRSPLPVFVGTWYLGDGPERHARTTSTVCSSVTTYFSGDGMWPHTKAGVGWIDFYFLTTHFSLLSTSTQLWKTSVNFETLQPCSRRRFLDYILSPHSRHHIRLSLSLAAMSWASLLRLTSNCPLIALLLLSRTYLYHYSILFTRATTKNHNHATSTPAPREKVVYLGTLSARRGVDSYLIMTLSTGLGLDTRLPI